MADPPGDRPDRVQLFATCLIETIRPQAGLAVVDILERLGLVVEYPEGQTCCGQPAFNSGSWSDARAMARHTLDVLSRSDAPVVVPSGSCADMIRHHYPKLLGGDPVYGPKATAVAARAYEFTEFLVEVLGVDRVPPDAAIEPDAPATKVTYHPSCHLLRGLGITTAPRRLLDSAGSLDVVDLPAAEECCGFGGLFAVKMSDISGEMLARKLNAIESSGAETVVACDVSCLIHIAGGLHRRGSPVEAKHIAEVLR